MTNTNAVNKSRRYTAFGKQRGGSVDTGFTYSGLLEDYSGLIYMHARYYDPSSGLFISPDTIIPNPADLMDYNRYTYGRGNPVSNNDPTGHMTCHDDACYRANGLEADANGNYTNPIPADVSGASDRDKMRMLQEAGIEFQDRSGVWSPAEKNLVLEGIVDLANFLSVFNIRDGLTALNVWLGESPVILFRDAGNDFHGAAAYVGNGRFASPTAPAGANSKVTILDSVFNSAALARGTIVHELTHVADYNAATFKGLSNSVPLDLATNYGRYIANLRADAQSWWTWDGFLAQKDLASETYAQRTAITVFSLPIYGNPNPYAWAVGVR